MNVTQVLFLCTGNSARSQMAEGFLRKYGGNRFEAHSAGLEPKGLNPLAVQVMSEIGIDISHQRSKSTREYLGRQNFGYLITVCSHAEENCPTAFLGISYRLHWPLDDPAKFEGTEEAKLAKFREVRGELDRRIRDWLADQGAIVKAARGS